MKLEKLGLPKNSFDQTKSMAPKESKYKQTDIGFKYSLSEYCTCLKVYKDYLYIGTKNEKGLRYKLESQHQKLKLIERKSFNCNTDYVNIIEANELYLLIAPKEEQKSKVTIINRDTLKIKSSITTHIKLTSKIIFLHDLNFFATCSYDGKAKVWDVDEIQQQDGGFVAEFDNKYPLLEMEMIEKYVLALGGDDCMILVWNWKKNQVQSKVFAHPGSVFHLKFFGKILVSSGGDSTFRAWQFEEKDDKIKIKQTTNKQFKAKLKSGLFERKELDKFQICQKKKNEITIMDSQATHYKISSQLDVGFASKKIKYYQFVKSIAIYLNFLLFIVATEKKGVLYSFVEDYDEAQVKQQSMLSSPSKVIETEMKPVNIQNKDNKVINEFQEESREILDQMPKELDQMLDGKINEPESFDNKSKS